MLRSEDFSADSQSAFVEVFCVGVVVIRFVIRRIIERCGDFDM